jgi:hypothetical protein
MTTSTAPQLARRPTARWGSDLAGTAGAVVCATITWLFVAHAAHVDLSVDTGGHVRDVGLADVVVAALVSAVAAFATLRALDRITGNALRVWSVAATAVAALSLFGTAAATNRPATLALISLHAVVASVIISSGVRSRTRRQPESGVPTC